MVAICRASGIDELTYLQGVSSKVNQNIIPKVLRDETYKNLMFLSASSWLLRAELYLPPAIIPGTVPARKASSKIKQNIRYLCRGPLRSFEAPFSGRVVFTRIERKSLIASLEI
jgi:hypothetical protein